MQIIRTNNHRFYYSFYANNPAVLDNNTNPNFKATTFKPFIIQKSALCLSELNKQTHQGLLGKFAQRLSTTNKTATTLAKWALCLGTVSLFALPVKGFLTPTVPAPSLTALESVIQKGEIVVATTKSDSTIFNHGDIQHGFGHDIAHRYADELGVHLNLKVYDSEQEALNALQIGDVDSLLGVAQTNMAGVRLACNDDTAKKVSKHGLNANMSLMFHAKDDTLAQHAKDFLCRPDELALTGSTARFYDQTLLANEYSDKHFKRALKQRLPLYENAFKRGAKAHNHDWQVLAVISYQESHLDPNAISRTGVEGLMMLTQDTAKAMGVKNRTDAVQSIQGGAKYLEVLEKLYTDVPESERLWFVLASYNMGPNAVKRIQSELNAKGRDGNSWGEVYGYLAQNASKNGRYVQCMHYVANIRAYLESMKTMQV
ncbi:lytic transglycosylase [Moraxella lacunata]|uniref:Transglycosylase SLT domain-containing protein n=1 Tax=Moraxella lacunata TaxID=477 RepID=A0A1B8PW56_MORLA|nr:transglycosylase SLT domain-containing protein [Moraxella lacunata]MDI4483657.1 lytic transglycosylase [Moraxella lacunata]MDI4508176.1 lytic transglycosylase [Moraxella lacunata]OBX60110.1 hypothetical protein A9309_10170 [Moraxella lacunata]OBX63159.1 hypothetical protein A9Z63_06335 [Moraxella lacunata]